MTEIKRRSKGNQKQLQKYSRLVAEEFEQAKEDVSNISQGYEKR